RVVGTLRVMVRARPGRSGAQAADAAAGQTATRQTQSGRRARRGRTRGQQPGQGGEPDPDEARRPRPGRGDGTRRPARPGRGAASQTRTRRRDEAAGQTRTRRGGPDPDQAARKPWPKLRASSARGRAPDPASRRPSPRPPLRQGRGPCHGPGPGAKPAWHRPQTGPVPAANRPGSGRPPYVRKITRSLRKARCVPHKAAPAVATSDPRVSSTGAAPGRLPSSTSRTMNSTFSTGTKYVQTATASVSANIKYMLGSITRNASAVMYAWASR